MKRTPLKRRTPLRSTKGLRKVTPKTAKANADLNNLVHYLATHRAKGLCEIRGTPECQERNYRPRWPWLSGHHVIKRARGRVDTAGNIIISCPDCHNHSRCGEGTPVPVEDLILIVNSRNKTDSIAGSLDGSQI